MKCIFSSLKIAAFTILAASAFAFADDCPKPANEPVKHALLQGLTARVELDSGTATIQVYSDSTITVDGETHKFTGDHINRVEVKKTALIVTNNPILVTFNGSGTYSRYRRDFTVAFSGVGTVHQDHYLGVRLMDGGHFTATNWEFVYAHDNAVVSTVDVRDVVAFEHAQVTVTNCWTATAFMPASVTATGCRHLGGDSAVEAIPPK